MIILKLFFFHPNEYISHRYIKKLDNKNLMYHLAIFISKYIQYFKITKRMCDNEKA